VFVYPEVDETIAIAINPADLRIDTFRASGAGGQHINKTDSAIRITHAPTGIVVQCQSDRSQHRNRAEAMAMLKARLYELELRKRTEEKQAMEDSKSDIGWGHQIRSYVLDQSRIKDLRTNVEIGNTQACWTAVWTISSPPASSKAYDGVPAHHAFHYVSTLRMTMDDKNTAPQPEDNQIIAERRAKLKALREKGIAFQ